MSTLLLAAGIVVALIVSTAVAWKPVRGTWRAAAFAQARREFHQQRERLEAQFVKRAAATGRPRGLRWADCEFDNGVCYARDRRSGELCAFVACTIAFEAIEGGGMEDVEAVGNLRAATAVFTYQNRRWTTQGRVMFNLNPAEAIAFYQGVVEAVAAEGPTKL
jgi:hypothetical protein